MDLAFERDWKALFALAAEAKAAKRREDQAKLFYADLDQQQEKKHKTKEKEEKEIKELLEAATAAQLAAFNQHLDSYDTQTVHALMENGEALDKVRTELRQMEENAYVLPDGRRVFKTQDGRRVLDEHGAEVGRDVIDPRVIEDKHTQWEPYKAAKDAKSGLEMERQGLLDYQARLDDARDRTSQGGMTKKQLDDLDADLRASAPPAVRQGFGISAMSDEREASRKPDDRSQLREAVFHNQQRRPEAAPALQ